MDVLLKVTLTACADRHPPGIPPEHEVNEVAKVPAVLGGHRRVRAPDDLQHQVTHVAGLKLDKNEGTSVSQGETQR